MVEELREFDDSIGRCTHCGELIFKSDDDWTIASLSIFAIQERSSIYTHIACESQARARASQI